MDGHESTKKIGSPLTGQGKNWRRTTYTKSTSSFKETCSKTYQTNP